MDWIKAKYDRLLLGVFGAVALLVGALLTMKAIGFKGHFKSDVPDPKEDYGTVDAAKQVGEATARLMDAKAVIAPPVIKGKPATLFSSNPVIKTVDGNVVGILEPDAPQVRPPIDNTWLFRNDLDITRTDIATVDSDSDGYTNAEEFLGKSSPRDGKSTPPVYTKFVYQECLEDPLTIRFATYSSDTDFQIQRTAPPELRKTVFIKKVGESFSLERRGPGQTEASLTPRFKVLKVEKRDVASATGAIREPMPVVILQDLLTPNSKPIEIVLKGEHAMPSLRAKIVNTLDGEEQIGGENAVLEFKAAPGFKFTITRLTKEEVVLSGKDEAKPDPVEFTLKLK